MRIDSKIDSALSQKQTQKATIGKIISPGDIILDSIGDDRRAEVVSYIIWYDLSGIVSMWGFG